MFRRFRAVICILLSVAAAACNASYPTSATEPKLVGLMIHVGAIGQLIPSNTMPRTFAAYSLDSDGTFRLVTLQTTWTSSDPGVVRLEGSSNDPARFRALAPGTATITARYQDVTASFPIVVLEPVAVYPRLVLTMGNPGLVGRVAQTTAWLEPRASVGENVTARAQWTSSDSAVATVDQDGTIRAVGIGTTVIRASFEHVSAFYWLSVAPGP